MNRREFLLSAGAAGMAAQAQDQKPKRVGLIGCGWYGKSDLMRLIQVAPVEVVSLCDVDSHMLEGAAELVAVRQASHKKPRLYGDYRKMLAEKDLDIVLVGTPDHWHALAAIAAMHAGADLFCQKPISADVAEGQAMLANARKLGRVVQVGTQRRSTPHLVDAVNKVIRPGLLGTVAAVDICCYSRGRSILTPDAPPPEYLNYEMWTGPAPMRPFNPVKHPKGWRSFMEYGNGIIGDMGIHMFDMTRWMLGLGWPKRISSEGGILIHKDGKANISDTQVAVFDYDDVKITWQHRNWGQPPNPDPKYTWSATLYGDKGMLKASVWSYDYIPIAKNGTPIHQDVVYELEQYPEDKTEPGIEKHCAPAMRRHMQNFLAAIATRGRPVADIEEGYISTSCCILANMSMKLGRSLAWDPRAQQVIGDDEANGLLARPYRAPWVHPSAA